MSRCTLLLAVLGVLAGCTRTVPPAPYELHGRSGAPTLSEMPRPHPDRVAVANGDTLYGISRRYGVPTRAIIDANGLQPPYRLVTGASLALPQVRTHVVVAGDTLRTVARQYGVDASTLATTNHLAPPYTIRLGEALILPAAVEAARGVSPPPAVAASPSVPVAVAVLPTARQAPPPLPATSLSTPVGMPPPAPPAAMPGLAPPTPAIAPAPPAAVALAPSSVGIAPLPSRPALAVEPPPVPPAPLPAALAPPPPLPVPPPEAKPAEQEAALPPATVSAKGFLWPVRGRVVATYGTDAEGGRNDGINIAAPAGTPVLAAEAGEVAYAGNELKGYGNLILLKHKDGLVTAYAHNETLLVKRGDKVARGQAIAKVGATGAVSDPQLHFEIRRGARALDPSEFLPAQAANR